MKRSWYYRMIFSYIPIFFIMTSFLFFIFFQTVNEHLRKNAIRTSELLTLQTKEKVEDSLETIDYELVTFSMDKVLNLFFQQKNTDNVFLNRQVLSEFEKIKQKNPLLDSIYLVRFQDEIVLSEKDMYNLKEFPDNRFISSLPQDAKQPFKWTNSRKFKEFESQASKNVVSLVRKVYTVNGELGFIVANVRVNDIQRMITGLFYDDLHFIGIKGKNKSPILTKDDSFDQNAKVISKVTSDYTGWVFESGFKKGNLYSFISMLSSIWVQVGIIFFILSIISLVYLTKRNYKPIESIVSNIHSLSLHTDKTLTKSKVNEFNIIRSAIEDLSLKSIEYQKQHEEGVNIQKKQMFYEIIEGVRQINLTEWKRESEKYHLPSQVHNIQVIVIELDQYPEFCKMYSSNDHEALKYTMKKNTSDIFQKHSLYSWGEWISNKQLTCIIFCGDKNIETSDLISKSCEEVIVWFSQNLKQTVTIGVGSITNNTSDISQTYKECNHALKFKLVKGTNRLIQYTTVKNIPQPELFNYLQLVREIAYAFRIGDKKWIVKFEQLFREIQKDVLSNDDIKNLLNYFIFHLDCGMVEELQPIWKNHSVVALNVALKEYETLLELKHHFFENLSILYLRIVSIQEANSNHQLMKKVKEYIKKGYMNPDLSLNFLSDRFGVNPKYLSQLFKTEFNEKFIDFLITIRVEKAKKLLMETDESIKNISIQVGYVSDISFIRAFKKVTDISPGEYRKKMSISK
ncbi:helix-turn-helix domain-containing protein [Neobacillus sp. NPDC093182]|uniref:helix-turn-helix domain-containing protein n=1 Tax=Neobacillus sp. NPDC093182 TaxID=3364297 RepID=UPI0038125AEC